MYDRDGRRTAEPGQVVYVEPGRPDAPRRTLNPSVPWQTALRGRPPCPSASASRSPPRWALALGAVPLRMADASVSVDRPGVAAMSGVSAAVVVVRPLMRPPSPGVLRLGGRPRRGYVTRLARRLLGVTDTA